MVELGIPDVKRISRGVVYGAVLTALGRMAAYVFAGLELVFLGSRPNIYGWKNETWGLADLPAVLGRLLGDTIAAIIDAGFGALTGVINAIAFTTPGPWDGLVFTLLVVLLGVLLARATLLGLEAIPVVGGPLASLLDRS